MEGLSAEALDDRLRAFLTEDLGSGDVTTDSIVPADAVASAEIVAKSKCVVSGLPVSRRVFELLDPDLSWEENARPGSSVAPGTTLVRLSGKARAILTAERVALNLLQRMCGIATATRRYVEAVHGTGCRILDTRKTAPGLRPFDREAVRDGGGANHRFGLFDMVLVKDNHRAIAGGVTPALERLRRAAPAGMRVEVEVESEEDVRDAVAAGADVLLIDNQSAAMVARWASLARGSARPPSVEASGGMTVERVRDYALAGADSISVGALTHSVEAADISLEIVAPADAPHTDPLPRGETSPHPDPLPRGERETDR